MMKTQPGEQVAVNLVIAAGKMYGYGNLISHLQTAWARTLVEQGMTEENARESTARDGTGYPFAMQDDILERGGWDETGEKYRWS